VDRAHPDLDHITGDLGRLSLWRDLGERAVLVALPRPGNLAGMPRGSTELIAAATDAGECVYVPGIGGVLVPTIEHFGPAGDQGTRVTWSAYDCDPVPAHTLEALSLSEIERGFLQELMERTRAIEALDARPWAGSPFRSMADRTQRQPMGTAGRAAIASHQHHHDGRAGRCGRRAWPERASAVTGTHRRRSPSNAACC